MYYGYSASTSRRSSRPAAGSRRWAARSTTSTPLGVRHEVPGVLRRQAVLLRVVEEPHYSMTLDAAGRLEKIWRFLPTESFLSPQDMKFGPDGSLYTLEWGGGFGRDNPNSGIYRIDYINGSRRPVAPATATPDNGAAAADGLLRRHRLERPEGGALTYAWDFDGDGDEDATADRPLHVHGDGRLHRAPDGHRPRRQDGHDDARRHGRQHPAHGLASPAPSTAASSTGATR